MSNKFGLKDLVLMVLVVVLIGVVILEMRTEDRQFLKGREASDALAEITSQVGALRRDIDRLQREVAGGSGGGLTAEQIAALVERLGSGGGPAGGASGGGSSGGGSVGAGASWAVAGVEIERSGRPEYFTDPFETFNAASGGSYTELISARIPQLTPWVVNEFWANVIINELVLEPMVMRHRERVDEFVGVLAEAWQIDPQGLWVRMKIRDEARWSDGKPVTAGDCVFAFKYLTNPNIKADVWRSLEGNLSEVVKIEDRVVEFRFKEVLFRNKITAFYFTPLPEHFYGQFTENEINAGTGLLLGSGPFRLAKLDPADQWKPGDELVLVRNEQYWGPAAPLDEIRWKTVEDPVSQLIEFTNGGADVMQPLAQQYVEKESDPEFLRENATLKWFAAAGGYRYIGWNTGERNGKPSVFADKRVRQAMTMLLDRERIVRDVWKGLERVAVGPFPGDHPATAPEIEPWPYDPERARALLAEAGMIDRNGDGVLEDANGRAFEFEFIYPSSAPTYDQVGAYLKAQCATVGIRCETRPTDWPVMLERLNSRDFDASCLGWATVVDIDPQQLWHSSSIAGQGSNAVQFSNARADELIDLGRSIVDDTERNKVWQELHRIIHEEQPYTFLGERPELNFHKRTMVNVLPYANKLWRSEFARASMQP